MKHSLVILLIVITCIISRTTYAQNTARSLKKTPIFGLMTVSAGGGATYYMGDLTEGVNSNYIRSNFILGFNYRLFERISARANLRYYGLKGTQAGTRNWYNNLSFKSDNFDGCIGLQFDLLKISNLPAFNPYLFGGIGLTTLNPKANYQGVWYSLAPLHTENVAYSRVAMIYFAGIGFTYRLNNRWNISLELLDNFSMSDYLDDVSTNYPQTDGMSTIAAALSDRRPEIALPANVPGNLRGNSKVKDSYGFLSIKLGYFLDSKFIRNEKRILKCLKF